ncbi:sugar phosphate isomerase/epimerase family protein [Nonomuraea diastatica]|uniref:Sugar phosphate isomerase/epimerase n=1 Tax=Nonomuraea diastatica TaxID=1848329 RepID=A0A4R4WD04_9ACTN|nr:TIM barrel protein [Nonomuraea diastatica]TDD15097.1 sugar phosphate isomerase/epimerase [Nonomuraea diastatica]
MAISGRPAAAGDLRISFNQLTARDLPLAAAARAARESGFDGFGVLPSTIAEHGVNGVRSVLDGEGLQPTSVCAFIGLIDPSPVARAERMAKAERFLAHAAELGVPLVVVVGGPSAGLGRRDAWNQAFTAIDTLLRRAAREGADLLVEPLHPVLISDSVATSVADALALVEQRQAGGIVVDTWHVWWDSRLRERLLDAGSRARIVHLSDWAAGPAGSLDRALPGEGCADVPAICADLLDAGFDGWWELEILSETLWAGDQVALVRASYESALRTLEKALSMAAKSNENVEFMR